MTFRRWRLNDNDIIDINDLLGVAKRVAGRIQDDDWAFYDNTGGNKLEYDDVSQVHKMDILIENNVEIDLSAILKGDVNASYIPDQHDKAPVTYQNQPRSYSIPLTVDTNTPSIEDSLHVNTNTVQYSRKQSSRKEFAKKTKS